MAGIDRLRWFGGGADAGVHPAQVAHKPREHRQDQVRHDPGGSRRHLGPSHGAIGWTSTLGWSGMRRNDLLRPGGIGNRHHVRTKFPILVSKAAEVVWTIVAGSRIKSNRK